MFILKSNVKATQNVSINEVGRHPLMPPPTRKDGQKTILLPVSGGHGGLRASVLDFLRKSELFRPTSVVFNWFVPTGDRKGRPYDVYGYMVITNGRAMRAPTVFVRYIYISKL